MKFYFWVIEFVGEFPRIPGQVNYACIRDVEDPTKQGFMDWTAEVDDAIQFARRRDAERFAQVYWWTDRECIAIREHEYVTFSDEDVAAVRAAVQRARDDMEVWRQDTQVDPEKMRQPIGPPGGRWPTRTRPTPTSEDLKEVKA